MRDELPNMVSEVIVAQAGEAIIFAGPDGRSVSGIAGPR